MRLLLLTVIFLSLILLIRFYLGGNNIFDTNKGEQVQGLLLPDLILSPPKELYIISSPGARQIRFTTTFINQGKGPLEVIGFSDLESGKTRAFQRITKIDGSTQDKNIGEFIFHPGHDHWHIENYSLFEIWSIKENNEWDKLLATTNKMSFCLWDENAYDLALENASQVQKYIGCNNQVQGISVGWSDTYEANVEGQELDISSLADGSYIVRSIINPDRKILERDYNNNEVIVRVEITGDTIVVR